MPRLPATVRRRVGRGRLELCVLVVSMALGLPTAVSAHDQNTSYTQISVNPQQIEVVVSFRPSVMRGELGFDTNGDGEIDDGELAAGAPALFEYLSAHTQIAADFSPLTLEPGDSFTDADERDNLLYSFRMTSALRQLPGEISVVVDFSDRLGESSIHFTRVAAGDQVQQAVLVPEAPRQSFVVGGTASITRQIGRFIVLGIEHIFLGYDHIFFLIALIVIGGQLKHLVTIVTAFTIAHSLTLVAAALELVSLPSRLVEVGIALSIAFVAAENFWLKKLDYRWIVTFCFGLVHGFGFANVLRDLGLPTRGLVSSLLAFNVGVELGQMAIVLLLFPIIIRLSRHEFHRTAVQLVSAVILAFGLGWSVDRIFELGFMPF